MTTSAAMLFCSMAMGSVRSTVMPIAPVEETLPLDGYAPDARQLVSGAQALADERKHVEVEPVHLLARALDRDRGADGGVAEVFRRAGADPVQALSLTEAALAKLPKGQGGMAY